MKAKTVIPKYVAEWIDGKIALNKHMIEDENKPSDFEIFLLADNDMLTKIKEELLKREVLNE